MPSHCVAFPIAPGKEKIATETIPALCRDNKDAYEKSRANAGLTLERVYSMPTPMGMFVVVYNEGSKSFEEVSAAFTNSGSEFDRRFIDLGAQASGIDPRLAPPPPVELLGEWTDPEVKERRPGLAFVAPVLPGKTDRGREIMRELFTQRREELAASRRTLSQNREAVYLMSTPMGDFACVYIEGSDPVEGNRRFAASAEPVDVWLKQQLKEIFPAGIDFNQPLPPITEILAWEAAPVHA